MKRTLSLLFAVIFLLLLAVPVSAKTINDLDSVCTNLKQYLYVPYVSHSALYPTYEKALSDAEKLLSNNHATQKEIDAHYDALKSAFAALFRDCFDYSALDQVAKDYESISSTLFVDETWNNLATVMKTIYKEIESPSIFKRGNMDKESYALNIKNLVDGHYSDFIDAYNQLVLKPLPEDLEATELVALLNYCNLSAPKSLMSKSSHWARYQNACKQVSDLMGQTPEQESINLAASELLESYQKLSLDCFDLSSVKKELERYQALSSNHYSESSWTVYKQQIDHLLTIEKEPQFFYLNQIQTAEEALASIDSFFTKKAEPATLAFESLVPQENINKLSALCNTYSRATASPGLEVKLKLLLESVDRGYKLLTNEASSSNDIDNAIEEIENAAENLFLAEEYLSSEQSGNVKSDVGTIRYIVVFTTLTLILSSICAVFFSYQQFGRINWQR